MNLNAFDLNLIRVFDALMKERSVTRAGDRIGLSQPAVSAALNRLRHVFNDPLFVRQNNDMLPTNLALELADHARSALMDIESMLYLGRELDLETLSRVFTLLGADFFSTLFLPALAGHVQRLAPLVQIRLLDSGRGDIHRLLLENEVDMALEATFDAPEWVSSQVMFRSPFVIIGSSRNPALSDIPEGRPIPLELFLRSRHAIRSISGSFSGLVDETLEANGLKRVVSLALPHFQGVAQAVAGSNYIAAIPVQFARAVRRSLDLVIFQPPVEVPAPEIMLYWHSRHDRDPAHQWMRQEILAQVEALDFPNIEIGI